MKGYCEWPANVTSIENNRIGVTFFGDQTMFKTSLINLYKFEESADVILANLRGRKTPLYGKAVMEAEAVLEIPLELSLMNRIVA